jgi:integrase
MSLVDVALEKYFEQLFVLGKTASEARYALQGWAWAHPSMPTSARTNFPLAKACLKGWKNMEPGVSRDPCPWEVALLLMQWLVENSETLMAFAVAISFDTYIRPGVLVGLRRENLLRPAKLVSGAYSGWGIVLSPASSNSVTKVGEQDDSLRVGTLHRMWIVDLIKQLWSRTAPGACLFDFTLAKFETTFKRATVALNLQSLQLVPHSLRHGGPSTDIYLGLRSLAEVQRRGFWQSPASVRRYEKHSKLLSQLNKLSVAQQRAARAAATSVPRLLLHSL